jgi:hypothetical protein
MTAFFALYKEGFTWLRRDKIFGPVLLIGLAVTFFASTASQWSMEDFQKILFDIAHAGYRLTGGFVAVLWGTRMVHDAMAERSLDPRIAAPIHRWTWYLARYCALATSLIIMGLVFAFWWQIGLYINNYGKISNQQAWAIAFLGFEWLVLAALSMLFASLSGFGLSLFFTIVAWLTGILAPLIATTIDTSVGETKFKIVTTIASVWNFQRFNLIDSLSQQSDGAFNIEFIANRLMWTVCLVTLLIGIGILRFESRDIN